MMDHNEHADDNLARDVDAGPENQGGDATERAGGDAQTTTPLGSRPPATFASLPAEIVSLVLENLHVPLPPPWQGIEDTPQTDLARCMRPSVTWNRLTAPILYRNVVIRDLIAFACGLQETETVVFKAQRRLVDPSTITIQYVRRYLERRSLLKVECLGYVQVMHVTTARLTCMSPLSEDEVCMAILDAGHLLKLSAAKGSNRLTPPALAALNPTALFVDAFAIPFEGDQQPGSVKQVHPAVILAIEDLDSIAGRGARRCAASRPGTAVSVRTSGNNWTLHHYFGSGLSLEWYVILLGNTILRISVRASSNRASDDFFEQMTVFMGNLAQTIVPTGDDEEHRLVVQLGYPDVQVFANGQFDKLARTDARTRSDPRNRRRLFPIHATADRDAPRPAPTPAEWIDMWQRGFDHHFQITTSSYKSHGTGIVPVRIMVQLAEGSCPGCGAEA